MPKWEITYVVNCDSLPESATSVASLIASENIKIERWRADKIGGWQSGDVCQIFYKEKWRSAKIEYVDRKSNMVSVMVDGFSTHTVGNNLKLKSLGE